MLASCPLFVFKMVRLVEHTLIKLTKFICAENILKQVSGGNCWHGAITSSVTDLTSAKSFKRYTIPTEKKK